MLIRVQIAWFGEFEGGFFGVYIGGDQVIIWWLLTDLVGGNGFAGLEMSGNTGILVQEHQCRGNRGWPEKRWWSAACRGGSDDVC